VPSSDYGWLINKEKPSASQAAILLWGPNIAPQFFLKTLCDFDTFCVSFICCSFAFGIETYNVDLPWHSYDVLHHTK
jgi:hypothetical protein